MTYSDVIIIIIYLKAFYHLRLSSSSNTNMISLFRPILRARKNPLAIRQFTHVARPISLRITATRLHARTVASSVSIRPGSQTLEHAATNVKEELGNSAADLAKVISGTNVTTDSVSDTESFVSGADLLDVHKIV